MSSPVDPPQAYGSRGNGPQAPAMGHVIGGELMAAERWGLVQATRDKTRPRGASGGDWCSSRAPVEFGDFAGNPTGQPRLRRGPIMGLLCAALPANKKGDRHAGAILTWL